MKTIITIISSGLLTALLYTGLFMDIEITRNIGLFLVWFLQIIGFLVSLLLIIFLIVDDDVFKVNGSPEKYVEKKSFLSRIVTRTFIICNIGMLVASGHFIAGAVYTFNFGLLFILMIPIREKAERILNAAKI